MPAESVPAPPVKDGPVVFINLWPEGGMKHYSESLIHALAPAGHVLYVRNYESCVSVDGLRIAVGPVRPGRWADLWRLIRTILQRRPRVIHLNSELPILLPLYPLFAFFNSIITLHDAVPHQGESLAKRLFMRLHLALIFLFLRKIIVHSEVIRAQLPAWLQARASILPLVNFQLWAG